MIVDCACIGIHALICKIVSFFLSEHNLVITATNLTLMLYCIGSLIVERKYSRWKISKELFNVKDSQEEYR